ncbi:hypothetical protein [Hyphomicrobium sp. DMF-1]|uniref:hypothetical protein n=1 Tax=Hyphomicrobium sp. DMF-1 TaxID=3019544 RepID=UPI0022EBB24F|nr:hypothetical protein [Hyphomicrobium sp. DMF-1]WBT38289.1 hypothetical protein PE058_21985 [Hyphomicrobium sp. DMF-1]
MLAMVRSCDAFAYVPGYDRCRIPSVSSALPSLVIAVLPAFLLPVRPTAGTGIIWIVYFMHVFGAVAVAPFLSDLTQDTLFFSLFISLSFIVVSLASNLTTIPFISFRINSTILNASALIVIIAALSFILTRFSVSFNLPSIYDVYDVRADFVDKISDGGGVDGYVMLISAYSLVPIGAILSFITYKRSSVLSASFFLMSALVTLVIYSVAAFKSSVFIFLLVSMIYIYVGDKEPFRRLLLIFSVVLAFALILDLSGVHSDSLIHWFRRVFIVPGLNVQFYLDEFGFFNDVAVPDAPSIISRVYFETDGSANAGLYGNGLARGGWHGILFVLFIFYLIASLANTIGGRVPLRISISLLFPSAYALSNSSITTVILSYGLMVNFIFLYGLANSCPAKITRSADR